MRHRDNETAIFLFAILKQLKLRNICWDTVARDPVLLQPVISGHAARMRYSRFREAVAGEGDKKTRLKPAKSRVYKTKKAPKATTSMVKRNPEVKKEQSPSQAASPMPEAWSCLSPDAHSSPAPVPSPSTAETRAGSNHRFLTPCSDAMSEAIQPTAIGNRSEHRYAATDPRVSPCSEGMGQPMWPVRPEAIENNNYGHHVAGQPRFLEPFSDDMAQAMPETVSPEAVENGNHHDAADERRLLSPLGDDMTQAMSRPDHAAAIQNDSCHHATNESVWDYAGNAGFVNNVHSQLLSAFDDSYHLNNYGTGYPDFQVQGRGDVANINQTFIDGSLQSNLGGPSPF